MKNGGYQIVDFSPYAITGGVDFTAPDILKSLQNEKPKYVSGLKIGDRTLKDCYVYFGDRNTYYEATIDDVHITVTKEGVVNAAEVEPPVDLNNFIKVIDLSGIEFETGKGEIVSAFSGFAGNTKAILLHGLNVDDVAYQDTFAEFTKVSSNYVATVHGLTMTVSILGSVTFTST